MKQLGLAMLLTSFCAFSMKSPHSSPEDTLLKEGMSHACVQATLPVYPVGDQTTCAICQDDFYHDDVCELLPCRHVYHGSCTIPMAMEHGMRCPTCKAETTNILGNIDAAATAEVCEASLQNMKLEVAYQASTSSMHQIAQHFFRPTNSFLSRILGHNAHQDISQRINQLPEANQVDIQLALCTYAQQWREIRAAQWADIFMSGSMLIGSLVSPVIQKIFPRHTHSLKKYEIPFQCAGFAIAGLRMWYTRRKIKRSTHTVLSNYEQTVSMQTEDGENESALSGTETSSQE